MKKSTPKEGLPGWDRLSHGGLLLDPARLHALSESPPERLSTHTESVLRKRANAVLDGSGDVPDFVTFTLEEVCGFRSPRGGWTRGSRVPGGESRRAVTGETVRPRQLWTGPRGARLPVFFDDNKRLGIGRGRRVVSRVFGWLRAGGEPLALLTNGREWRLLFAGLDYEAWCQWDVDLWFEEGELSPQVTALRTLLSPDLWIPETEGAAPKLLAAIRDTRKGQAELSETLGERVREAVEVLIRGHGEALRDRCADVAPADIYRAACRVAMRLVVILFAEARGLLPRNNALYDASYGLNGLYERLDRAGFRGGLRNDFAAWPRVLALFGLVRDGSHHPELPVAAYGGELFAPGALDAEDGVSRALSVFEIACLEREFLPDRDVHQMLRLLTRTTVRIRQARAGTRVTVPVDFSDLSSEYIGVLYEGLLDYELKAAPEDDPVIFLAVGNREAALPLSRLEAMDGRALKALFESLKKTDRATAADEEAGEEPPDPAEDGEPVPEMAVFSDEAETTPRDARQQSRERAVAWARGAAQAAGLVRKFRGRDTPERRLAHDRQLDERARKLVVRIVLPGEWYLVRWGGTRKGSGSFYTRPGLAVPTVHRTLRPLAYNPPTDKDGSPDPAAPAARWTPKTPERILALTVCDPACGSGTFPLAALRFLTEALYASLQHHGRLQADGERTLVRLLGIRADADREESPADELIPCRPDEDDFEPRLRAVLRRYVVERCIYAVDLDPLAVELCRLSLWIETMDRNLPFGFLDHKIKCGNALVGTWFDHFRHYPAMAWKNREGGDRNHSNGVHFEKNARTKAIKAFVKKRLTPDLRRFLRGRDLFQQEDLLSRTSAAHDEAFAVLAKCHNLPVRDADARARMYREDFLGSEAWQSLREAMDLWCACWFWPAEEVENAPLPTNFADPPADARAVAEHIAAQMRFFHWELEFPDVFRAAGSGFDAILGNPPWDTLQPNSNEFFSDIDPLYRSYGKQQGLQTQSSLFESHDIEQHWLDYIGKFANDSNWMKYAGSPFGDPTTTGTAQSHFVLARGTEDEPLHDRWRKFRSRTPGFAETPHPFIHRGEGKAYTYKLFLEQAHALCRDRGRLGFLVPSGLYSDHGTRALRNLFLERCRWEWLFGFENRDGVFPIDSRLKFNPVIVQKGRSTEAIWTAFMRRNLDDWERAEQLATRYTRAQIERFSPKSRAILEIQSQRDLEILDKIYANAVLLGDEGPDGWGIVYRQGDFNITSDSALFPPREQWEAKGYRADEYSRWLLGDWRPISELWAELGVDPSRPDPAEIDLEEWLFDTTSGSERRNAEARFVHGHLLNPGDVARTVWRSRCAQPPYDDLPVPRASIPTGVILSREADSWIREDRVRDRALPLYQGLMFSGRRPNVAQHLRGSGRRAKWKRKIAPFAPIQPQFLIGDSTYRGHGMVAIGLTKIAIRGLARATDERTIIAGVISDLPAGHSINYLTPASQSARQAGFLILSSLVFDWQARLRIAGTNMTYNFLEEMGVPAPGNAALSHLRHLGGVGLAIVPQAPTRLEWQAACLPLSPSERVRTGVMVDALVAAAYGLESDDVAEMLTGCALPEPTGKATGFWRVDQDKDPELRQTVLTLVALHDLEVRIRDAGGDRGKGVEAFLNQNHGEGWLLPETLRLADYRLGHDDRARHPQPVASRLGPRFFDWQLTQTPEESWRECHLHARNLLGEHRYGQLLEDAERGDESYVPADADLPRVAEPDFEYNAGKPKQPKLF